MTDDKDPRSKIVRIIKDAHQEAANDGTGGQAARPKPKRRPRQTANLVTVKGDGNVVGNRNVIALNPRVVRKTVVKTGDGTVSAQQKAVLQQLIKEWVESRAAVRRSEMSYGAAWSAFNKAHRINSYHELPASKFELARAWLKRQSGILSSMASARKRLPGWRTKQIASIKARCKNQLGDEFAYLGYIEVNFGVDSLTLLDDDQIHRVYQYVMRKRV